MNDANTTMTDERKKTVMYEGAPFGAAYGGYGEGTSYTCTVDAEGVVRVFDSIADHYTRCHRITEADQDRIRDAAEYSTVWAPR